MERKAQLRLAAVFMLVLLSRAMGGIPPVPTLPEAAILQFCFLLVFLLVSVSFSHDDLRHHTPGRLPWVPLRNSIGDIWRQPVPCVFPCMLSGLLQTGACP